VCVCVCVCVCVHMNVCLGRVAGWGGVVAAIFGADACVCLHTLLIPNDGNTTSSAHGSYSGHADDWDGSTSTCEISAGNNTTFEISAARADVLVPRHLKFSAGSTSTFEISAASAELAVTAVELAGDGEDNANTTLLAPRNTSINCFVPCSAFWK
jgi:hypothetical protein